jgi:hypothetical protein
LALVALLAAVAAPTALGGPANLFSVRVGPVARVISGGDSLWVPIRYRCTQSGMLKLRLSVFQAGAGAFGQAKLQATCTGQLQKSVLKVSPGSSVRHRFGPGFARACWLGATRRPSGFEPSGFDALQSQCNGLSVTAST